MHCHNCIIDLLYFLYTALILYNCFVRVFLNVILSINHVLCTLCNIIYNMILSLNIVIHLSYLYTVVTYRPQHFASYVVVICKVYKIRTGVASKNTSNLKYINHYIVISYLCFCYNILLWSRQWDDAISYKIVTPKYEEIVFHT